MKWQTKTVGAAIAVVVGIAAVNVFKPLPTSTVSVSPSTTATVPPAPLPITQVPQAPLTAAVPLPAPRAGETRTQMLDRLVAGTPAEALTALNTINVCVTSRELEPREKAETDPTLKAVYRRAAPPPAEACDGVMAGHLTQRMPLAIRAAEAGVPGAFAPLWKLALDGEPNDPTLAAKWAAIRERYIKAADPAALSESLTLAANCSPQPACRDEYAELVRWTALKDVMGPQPYPDNATPAFTKRIGAERAAQAIKEGHALAAAARGTK